jgi:acyl-CoA thioesterase FadM
MNLFFRLILLVLKGMWGKRNHFSHKTSLDFRVGLFDLDINMHMTNSRYLSFMDLGRLDMLIRTGFGSLMIKDRWQAVLGGVHVQWRKGLSPFQKFTLETSVIGWDGKWIYMEQKFLSQGSIYCLALVRGAFLHKGKRQHVSQLAKVLGEKEFLKEKLPLEHPLWCQFDQIMKERIK